MKKNVWDMTGEDIALINGKRYKVKRDFEKLMIGIGRQLNRELVNVNEPEDIMKYYRGREVEIEKRNW